MTTPADNLPKWPPRRDELAALMQRLTDEHPSDVPRAATLRALLVCLRSFGNAQLDFFLKGFAATGRLTPLHHLYSPNYALDVTVNQIGYDLDLLLRASHQRSTCLRTVLAGADQVAMAYLAPAVIHDLVGQATALTYCQKSLSIRLAPYAPVALVGIPFHATGRPQEIVTIAHEVGHYVAARRPDPPATGRPGWSQFTRNGSLLGVRRQLGASAPAQTVEWWLDGWRDEIYADVYTCIVGGPQAATTLLELLRGLPATRWLDDDGEHPLPILRPVIYAAALRQLAQVVGSATAVAGDLLNAASHLDSTTDQWQMRLPDWVTFQTRSGPRLDLAAVRSFIAAEVATLVQHDLHLLCPRDGAQGRLWSLLEINQDLGSLDLTTLPGEPVTAPPELIVTDDLAQTGWAGGSKRWRTGSTGLDDATWERARDQLLNDHNGDAHDELARSWNPWWLGVLSAGTWTTEGPGPGNPQPGG